MFGLLRKLNKTRKEQDVTLLSFSDIMRRAFTPRESLEIGGLSAGRTDDEPIWQGSWTTLQDSMDVCWHIAKDGVYIDYKLPATHAVQRCRILFSDIVEMNYLETGDKDPQLDREATQFGFGKSTPSTLIPDSIFEVRDSCSFLYVLHKDADLAVVRNVLIPFNGNRHDYRRLRSVWVSRHLSDDLENTESCDDFKIISSGKTKTEHGFFTWLLNKKALSCCYSYNLPFVILLSHIFKLELCRSALVVHFADLDAETSPHESLVERIVEKRLEIQSFGTEKDYRELCLLWRQEVQIQLIDDIFGVKSAETVLSNYCRRKQPNSWTAEDPSFDSQTNSTTVESSKSFEQVSELISCPPKVTVRETSPDAIGKLMDLFDSKLEMLEFTEKKVETFSVVSIGSDASTRRSEASTTVNESPASERSSSGRSLEFAELHAELKQKIADLTRRQNPKSTTEQVEPADSNEESPRPTFRARSSSLPFEALPERLKCATVEFVPIERELYAQKLAPQDFVSQLENCMDAGTVSLLKRQFPQDFYLVSFSYHKAGPGEMNLERGDYLRVIKWEDSGWWYAVKLSSQLQGDHLLWNVAEEGWVPSNYLVLSSQYH